MTRVVRDLGSQAAPGEGIALLSPRVAEQIAAGEVIDRPASVVRELCDNALDAGASRVDVALEGGGKHLIRVVDDGRGMTPAEVRLALERHATSKLRELDDLLRTRTLGFRGEGLTSVAVVSKLTVRSRPRGAAEGSELSVEGGRVVSQRPVGCAVGTAIEARDLFFNVPARRTFLKSTATEAALVSELVERKALACCPVRFELRLEGRSTLSLAPTADRRERVRATLRLAGGELRSVQRGEPGVAVELHMARLQRAISTARGLRLIVNGRPIRDRALLTAVLRGVEGRLSGGRFPQGVVYVDLDPSALDINVHPQKSEVRFARPRQVFELLQAATAELFGDTSPRRPRGAPLRPPTAAAGPSADPPAAAAIEGSTRSYRLGVGGSGRASEPARTAYIDQRARIAEATRRFWAETAEASDDEDFGLGAALGRSEPPSGPKSPGAQRPVAIGRSSAGLLLVERRGELFVVEPRAATRRLLERTLGEELAAGPLSSRELSPPQPLGKELARALAERDTTLRSLGFEVEEFGAGRHVLRRAPAALGDLEAAQIAELLSSLAPELPKEASEALLRPSLVKLAAAAALEAADEERLLDDFAALGAPVELRAASGVTTPGAAAPALWRLPDLSSRDPGAGR